MQTAGGLHDSTLNQPRQVSCRILARVLVSPFLCTSSDGNSMLHVVWDGGEVLFPTLFTNWALSFFFFEGKSSHNLRKGIEK